MSETSLRRHLTSKHCVGNGVDIGSGGDPVVPTAIQVDLPNEKWVNRALIDDQYPIQWRTESILLPFKDGTLDYVYSSHLLEDFLDWQPVLQEWVRALKPGGKLIVMVPDHERFRAATLAGQPDNLDHKHEAKVGELSTYADELGLDVIEDRLSGEDPKDYNILFIAVKR